MSDIESVKPQEMKWPSRRGAYYNIADSMTALPPALGAEEVPFFERLDLAYRTLCGVLYNFVPTSGHPGGSISSGRFVEGLLYRALSYDFSDPLRNDADIISYAAGHKAMGLYAMWALRNELVRIAQPGLLPSEKMQLRLEDLLG
ncbi:MAG TPA: hypothetical protein P5079_11130, partial [Elusimicrobiota bacterium]|nr:hypothetical protein [Elusimicrobiota bacterium]